MVKKVSNIKTTGTSDLILKTDYYTKINEIKKQILIIIIVVSILLLNNLMT